MDTGRLPSPGADHQILRHLAHPAERAATALPALALIFVGVGPWSLALNLYQAASTTAPNPSTWDWVWTVIFMAVAIGALVDIGVEIVGAAALITIGLVVLI